MSIKNRFLKKEKKSSRWLRFIRDFTNNKNIKYKNLDVFLKEHRNIVLIDVRSNQEYREGHIKNSINIPLYEIEKKIERIISNKEADILVYCRSGARSKKAAQKLSKMGYINVYNIEDGIR